MRGLTSSPTRGLVRPALTVALAAASLSFLLAVPTPAALSFTDITDQAGITFLHDVFNPDPGDDVALLSGGVAAEDFDGDGLLDLYFSRVPR